MAKRTPRSEANEVAAAEPAPARKRARTGRAADAAQPAPQGAPETAGPTDVANTAAPDYAANTAVPDYGTNTATREDRTARTRSESMASEPSEEDIRTRAYHLYLERGGEHGNHEDDWYRAEQELKNGKK